MDIRAEIRTVAAVREAVLHGWPGIAVSHYRRSGVTYDWERAARWVHPILKDLLARPCRNNGHPRRDSHGRGRARSGLAWLAGDRGVSLSEIGRDLRLGTSGTLGAPDPQGLTGATD